MVLLSDADSLSALLYGSFDLLGAVSIFCGLNGLRQVEQQNSPAAVSFRVLSRHGAGRDSHKNISLSQAAGVKWLSLRWLFGIRQKRSQRAPLFPRR
jgi:hypothetical protein